MEIGTKGQFYILILVFMISVVVGVAYFTTESKQLEQETDIEQEPMLQTIMDGYESELKASIEGGLYSGNPAFYQEVEAKLTTQAAQKGYGFTSDCTRTPINSYSEQIDCDIELSVGENVLTTSFSHTYAVEFGIELYADEDYTHKTTYYAPGDTIYYRVTSPAPSDTNVTINYPDDQEKEKQEKSGTGFANFATFGTIDVDETTGEWEISLDSSADSMSTAFYVQESVVDITTYDSSWIPQDTFNRGEEVKYRIVVSPSANVYMDVTAGGQDRDYDWWSDAPSTLHESSFVVSSVESSGTVLTLTAIEDGYFGEASVNITVLYVPYGAFIPVDLEYEHVPFDAFKTSCGYEEWYAGTTTNNSGVPFDCVPTGDAVVRVANEVEVISVPHVYADKLHILSSRCDDC
ncbi:hypothetical protein ACFLQ2_00805 [archaeon]